MALKISHNFEANFAFELFNKLSGFNSNSAENQSELSSKKASQINFGFSDFSKYSTSSVCPNFVGIAKESPPSRTVYSPAMYNFPLARNFWFIFKITFGR